MPYVEDHLIRHKFRRAPFGSGKMFKECKETIALLLSRRNQCEVPVEPFVASIANDLGIEPAMEPVIDSLHQFLRLALGPRVEMRRWFTYVDSAPALERCWHTLLLALTAMCLFEGKGPLQIKAESASAAVNASAHADGGESEDERAFQYKSECLRILRSTASQSVLRSIKLIFKRTRHHQAWVAKHAFTRHMSTQYVLFWAHPVRYLQNIVLPSIQASLCHVGGLSMIGIAGDVPLCRVA